MGHNTLSTGPHPEPEGGEDKEVEGVTSEAFGLNIEQGRVGFFKVIERICRKKNRDSFFSDRINRPALVRPCLEHIVIVDLGNKDVAIKSCYIRTMNHQLNIHTSSVLELWKEAGRPVDVRIEGASMLPLIRPGDTVSLRLINGDELKKTGDLIAFRQDGCLIVHRFIKQRTINKSLRFCQKGDNLPGWSWISEDDVLGRVESIRGLGRKVIYMNTRPWTWINRVMGISWFLWISFVEKVRLSKAYAVVGRLLPIIGGLAGRLGRALNSVYGYIVIKTIGGIKT